jgi:serine/threonine protein kinase
MYEGEDSVKWERFMADSKADEKQSQETELNMDAANTEKFPSTEVEQTSEHDYSELIGTIFEGKYKIESKLGEGGMGVVYRAMHMLMDRPVAIKFLHSDRLTDNAAIERFKREARAAGRIQHPNATAVLDFGIANDIFYLVMEYLEGRTLRDRLRAEGPLSGKEALRIMSQVCKAVDYAHKCNVIHRDLKPDNIFLQKKEDEEVVKVLDFGIAKITLGGSSTMIGSTTEMFMGTPHYMSPEQCQADPLDPTSDIYSLGVILFEMLTGKLPFKGNSLLSIAIKHLNEQPPSLCEFRPDLPKEAEAVIMRALMKDSKKRQQTASQLAEEFRQALGMMSTPAARDVKTLACSNPSCAEPQPSNSGRCQNCQAMLIGVMVRHRYEIQQMVGRGGFGTTYLVSDQDCLDEARILKELHSGQSSEEIEEDMEEMNVAAKRLFRREAQVLLNLEHPGIPKLYAYFIDKDYSYLVQDFIPGHTLLEEVEERNRVLNEQEARALLAEMADILEYLHTRTPPIVHRDIKPQNLMRHSSGKLLLIDFGAVCQAASNPALNQTLIGSPGYAPAEQIFGRPVPQSDLYAAGATVLRLLTGVPPSQLFNNKTQLMEWESRVKVSPQFAALLNDLLVQDVKKRLGSASDLKKRLQKLDGETAAVAQPAVSNLVPEPPSKPQRSEPPQQSQISSPPQQSMGFEAAKAFHNSQLYASSKLADEVGKLEEKPILFLLRRFYREHLSGSVTCINDNVVKVVHFNQGAVIFANSTLENERLGEMLVRTGRISSADFERATTIMKSRGIRFGSALVEMGAIPHDELKPLIIAQASNIIYSLFEWARGRYEVRHEQPTEESVRISLSTADIIFEGLRRMKNIDLVKIWLGDFKRKLSTTSDPLLLYQAINLNPKEAFIVSRIDSMMSIEEILSMGGLPEAETLKTLCGLLAVGILEWVDAETSRTSKPPVAVAKVLSGPQSLPSDFDIQTAATFCYEVENLLRGINNANYYALLGIERGASEEEIRDAYARMAKKFHPDRHAQLANYNFSLRAELEKIFAHLSEAHKILSDPIARADYDSIFRSSGKIRIPASEVEQRHKVRTPSEPSTSKKRFPSR